MKHELLPDLTFPVVRYGEQETPWDLRPLLYNGYANAQICDLDKLRLSPPCQQRVEFVSKLHDEINGNLVGGGSRYTAYGGIRAIRHFFLWADAGGHELHLQSAAEIFRHWTDYLLDRQRREKRSFEWDHQLASTVGRILDKVLERSVRLINETRLGALRRGNPRRPPQFDKQNLGDAFKFGNLLFDVCEALTTATINGPLPVRMEFRTGLIIEEWLGLKQREKLKPPRDSQQARKTIERYLARGTDTSLRVRHPVINLRIEAELMVFISQTGMNLAQAYSIRNGRFHYTGYLDGYQVRHYKDRRHGEVEFEIYGEYKKQFERYVAWRNEFFPHDPDGLLFPFIRTQGRSVDAAPTLHQVKSLCEKLNVRFIGPRELRNTRVNWLLRRTRDPDLTAEMAQHTRETLLGTYERPNLQVAMIEIAQFHDFLNPATSPPGPGRCISSTPVPAADMPASAPQPDCATPAGCLFCGYHRDIDSDEHVWSLASFRYLKSLELVKYRPAETGGLNNSAHPALVTIERVTAKLRFFESSSEVRSLWVHEALARIAEGAYHPAWDGFIQLQEVQL